MADQAKSFTNMAWNAGSRMSSFEGTHAALESKVSVLQQDTSDIKSMMLEIF